MGHNSRGEIINLAEETFAMKPNYAIGTRILTERIGVDFTHTPIESSMREENCDLSYQ